MRQHSSLPVNQLPIFLFDNTLPYLFSMVQQKPVIAGERLPGLSEVAAACGIQIARATQWREAVMTSTTDGRRISASQYFEVYFEDMILNPPKTFRDLFLFLSLDFNAGTIER